MASLPYPETASFMDPATKTITHIVRDPSSRAAAVIDPVLDFDPASGKTWTGCADRVIEFIRDAGLGLEWILETHVHADHLTAAPYIKEKLGGRIAIGKRIAEIQDTWNSIFNYKEGLRTGPGVFDHLFGDGDAFSIGGMPGRVMETPGHTNIDVTYVIGDAAFVGDTLFMPDYGTARADFPGGDARKLYRSIKKILSLPDATRLYLCHDYLPQGRSEYRWQTTVAEEKNNLHIRGKSEDEFAAMREAKDKTLGAPALLYPSLQVNIRAGQKPPAEDNGISYLKVPLR